MLCFVILSILIYFSSPTVDKRENTSHIEISNLKNNDIIKDHVHLLNSTCPIDINNGSGTLKSVFFDGQKITYNIDCLSDLTYEEFSTNMKKNMDNLILYLYVIHNGESDVFLNDCINRKCDFSFNLFFPDDETASFMIPYSNLISAKEYVKTNKNGALHQYILTQIALANMRLPYNQDEGLVLESLAISNRNVVFNIKADSDYYRVCKSNYDEAKTFFYQDLKQSSLSILESCKTAELGIKINVRGNGTQKKIVFDFPFYELEKDPFFINLDMSKIYLL